MGGGEFYFEQYAEPLQRWYAVTAYSARAGYFVTLFHDITERKLSEAALQEANQALEQKVAERTSELQHAVEQLAAANKELESFSYSVSHDLRAPLRSIDGFSRILLEDYGAQLDDEGKDYLQRVRASSQRMAQLIDDLLQLSRVTRSELRRADVNLSELARSVIAELQERQPNGRSRCALPMTCTPTPTRG